MNLKIELETFEEEDGTVSQWIESVKLDGHDIQLPCTVMAELEKAVEKIQREQVAEFIAEKSEWGIL